MAADGDFSSSQDCYFDWPYDQKKFNATIPRIPCVLSMIGSGYIIFHVIKERKWTAMYNRLILGLSVTDMIGSFSQFFTTWPIPADSVVDGGPSISHCYYGNVGNLTACEVQGFFIHSFTIAVPIYNAMLCVYFLLFIRYDWNEQRLRKIEPFMHGLALYPMMTAIICWNEEVFNPAATFCWIAGHPLGCLENDDVDCIRGKNVYFFRWAAVAVPIMCAFITIVATMSMICVFVFRQESRLASLQSAELERGYEHSKKVFWQACRYVGAYLFVFLPSAIVTILSSRYRYNEFAGMFALSLLIPLQGLFNAMIYFQASISCWWIRYKISRAFSRFLGNSISSESEDDSSFDDVTETHVGETCFSSIVPVTSEMSQYRIGI